MFLPRLVCLLTGSDDAQRLGHARPRRPQTDEGLDVLVLPGLRLLVQEVQRVHVPHAVSDEHHGPTGFLRHLLDHLLQLQEILFILV